VVDETRRQQPVEPRPPAVIKVAGREDVETSRTSPRMRFDLLQVAAWLVGLYLIVGGLIAIARAGFGEMTLFEPVVDVGGQGLTPLYAVLWLVVGVLLLVAGTGVVNETALRVGGVLFGIAGAVFLVEPGAFTDYLGVTAASGTMLLVVGTLLVGTSFVPPLSIARPGVPQR
jgi:hypothetical protein